MTLQTAPTPTQYLSCKRPYFDETCDICPGNIFPMDILSIYGISHLLLTRCWTNFKGGFLEPSLTDANRYGDTCWVNISGMSQLLLTKLWANFKCRSKKKKFDFNFWEPDHFTWSFLYHKLWSSKFFGPQNVFWPNFFLRLYFFKLNVLDNIFWTLLFFTKFFFDPTLLDLKFLDMDNYWIRT